MYLAHSPILWHIGFLLSNNRTIWIFMVSHWFEINNVFFVTNISCHLYFCHQH